MNIALSTQVIFIFLGKSFGLLISLLIPIILARSFSQDDFGLYIQIIFVVSVLIEVSKWGIINSLYHYYSTNSKSRAELLSQSFYMLLLIGLIIATIILFFDDQIYNFLNIVDEPKLLGAMIIYVLLMLSSLILDSIYILEKKVLTFFIYEIVNKSLKAVFILFAFSMYGTIIHIIYFITLYAFVKFIFTYFYLRQNYKISLFKIKKSLLVDQIKYFMPIGCARLVGEIGKKADKFLLIYFLSPTSYAIYAIAYLGIPVISLLVTSISQVVVPKMSLSFKNNEILSIKQLWHKAIFKYALLIIPLIGLFEILAEEIIIILFTDKYVDSVVIYQIFLLGIFLNVFSPSIVLRSVKKTKVIFYSHFFSAIAAIICGYFLIKSYGMIGGAISFLIASTVRTFIQLAAIKKFLTLKLVELVPWSLIFRITIISVISSLLIMILPFHIDTMLISVFATSLLYLASVLLLYMRYGFFDIRDVVKIYHTILKVRK